MPGAGACPACPALFRPAAPTLPKAMEQAARPIRPPLRLCGCCESANSTESVWITCLICAALFCATNSRTSLQEERAESGLVSPPTGPSPPARPRAHFSISSAATFRFSYSLSFRARTMLGVSGEKSFSGFIAAA